VRAESEISDLGSDLELAYPEDEDVWDRLYALRDIVPPATRSRIANATSKTGGYLSWGIGGLGKLAFVVTTTVLVLGVPWALAYSEDQQMMELEREQRAREGGLEMMSAGPEQSTAEQVKAAL
jgi:import receptor subunit TOM22